MASRRAVLTALLGLSAQATAQERTTARPDTNPDATFLGHVLPLASLSLAVSRLALDRLVLPKLTEFAQFEAAAQATFLEVSHAFQQSRTTSGAEASSADQAPETNLGDKERETLGKLQAMPPGTDFSRAYFVLEISIQQNLLRLYESFLKDGRDARLLTVAKLADATVREHLQLLTDIKEDADNGKGAFPPGAK
jgi:putative membrane protein